MNFDPQKFFIGLMDFFSILLPGALVTYLFMGDVGPVVLGESHAKLTVAQGWAIFLFASYLFGHLIFLLGSWLDEFYDWARRYTLNTQISLVARRCRLLPWLARVLIWLVFKQERDIAVRRATMIKRQVLGALQASDSINTFQWCKALLNIDNPRSIAVVQRFEADSKFFRCFAIVLLIILLVWPWQQRRWPLVGIAVVVVLLLLALWRYMEQRFKASSQAYWAVLTLMAERGKIQIPNQVPTLPNTPTHAGGVVYRTRLRRTRYLLVEARDNPDQWVLPKGHVETGELYRETAVREVHEETGIWACPLSHLSDVSWTVDESSVSTRFFLMHAKGRGLRKEKHRQRRWLPLLEAIALASHVETRELLLAADQRRSRPADTATATSVTSATPA